MTNDVKVIALCLKHELKRLKCWSDEVDSNLKFEDQGIYCITRKEEEATETSLLLFNGDVCVSFLNMLELEYGVLPVLTRHPASQ
ncbi:hypothetical protein PsorP6_012143 [Peronosclerospora sorghi]|uniref:Uncharacterized protein n=1 Tax=Peronosclerospora sorghi TaxID=230839 RepID=A0ACC0WMG2_9STRA|nr:hypothetical protein PsorP6_012143 [Peronosclerospora sorghi]